MIQTAYYREKNIIRSVEKQEDGGPKETLVFNSISEAKKRSHAMQLKHGGLGSGYVQLVKETKKSKKKTAKKVKWGLPKKTLKLKGKPKYKKLPKKTHVSELDESLNDIYVDMIKGQYKK